MSLSDFLQVLRRRWLAAAIAFVAVMGAAVAALVVQTPMYSASVTVGLTCNSSNAQCVVVVAQTAGAILPLYSEAATSADTSALAAKSMPAGEALGSLTVDTFSDTPTIMRLDVTADSPLAAKDSAQHYFDALQSRASAGEIGSTKLFTLTELGSPTIPTSPSSPHKALTLAVGLLLGLVIAAGAAWLRENVGGTIETAEGLAAAAELPLFGEVPEARRVPTSASVESWLNDEHLRFVTEAMRDLSLTLQLTQFESDSVLVTSPEGRHGKTTVAFGIAVALARSGVDTLLVDGDLRRGRVEQMFADEPDHPIRKGPGLVDVLRGLPLEDAVQRTSLPNLSLLTSGTLQEDPSELLDVAFPIALRAMERRSAVVIDGTPLVPINDARVIAKFVGSTIVVAGAGSATKAQVKRALDRVRIIGVTPSAVVLNKSRKRNSAAYGLYLENHGKRRNRGGTGGAHSSDQAQGHQPAADPAHPLVSEDRSGAAARLGMDTPQSARVTLVGPEGNFGVRHPTPQEWPDDGRSSAQQP